MISVDEVRALLLAGRSRLPPRRVPLDEALGAIAAHDVLCWEAVPPFAASAMDGYALRSADTPRVAGPAGTPAPVRLRVLGTVLAGDGEELALGPGQAMRIMTGAPVPPGADAVLVLERARLERAGGVLCVEDFVPPGQHVRPAGDDLAPGDLLVAAGGPIGPAELAMLASVGESDVSVVPRPVVGVLSTGDELSEGPVQRSTGRVRDANRPLLGAALRAAGFPVADLGIVGDDAEAIAKAVADGVARCDVVVTSGGVCAGDRDLMAGALAELSGGRARSVRVAVRPGKPLAFADVGGVPVVGLPGNPVAALVALQLLAMPLLRRLAGEPDERNGARSARSEAPLRRIPDGRLHVLLGVARDDAGGGLVVAPCARQGSHLLGAVAESNALILLPDGPGAPAGEEVSVLPLPGWGGRRARLREAP